MDTMRTFYLFLASSNELKYDRIAFGNFVRRLDYIYEEHGERIKLYEWEDFDSAYNNCRKQNEYNDKISQSDLFLALFHQKAGEFTIEEFKFATEQYKKQSTPKVYVYCKDIQDGEIETPELSSFKDYMSNELDYFWNHYSNSDDLQLQFLLQLLMQVPPPPYSLCIKDGQILMGQMVVAHFDNLKFVQNDISYKKMCKEMHALQIEIERKCILLDKHPEIQELRIEYIKLRQKYDNIKKELTQHQTFVLELAQLIAKLQGKKITTQIKRAITAFENGKIHEAYIMLNGIEDDLDNACAEYRKTVEIAKQKRFIAFQKIEGVKLKISIIQADLMIPVSKRIEEIEQLYLRIIEIVKNINYNKSQLVDLLFEFANFYTRINKMNEAESLYEEMTKIIQDDRNGIDKLRLANVFLRIGEVRHNLHDDIAKIAMDFNMALHIIREYVQKDKRHNQFLSQSLCMVSQFCYSTGNHIEAKTLCMEALEIYRQFLKEGEVDFEIYYARALAQLASMYEVDSCNIKTIDEYFQEAIGIFMKNDSNIDVAKTLINIGNFHDHMKNYKLAEEKYKEALTMLESMYNDIDIINIWQDKAKVLYNLALAQERLDATSNAKNIERELKEALWLYTDLEEINYGTFLHKIRKVVNELGFFYQTIRSVEKLEAFRKDIIDRLLYIDAKSEGRYKSFIQSVEGILHKYEKAIDY